MLPYDDIAVFGYKARVPFAAPFAAREGFSCHHGDLSWVGVAPALIVARLPATVRNEENAHSGSANGWIDRLQIGEQPDLVSYRLDTRPDLATPSNRPLPMNSSRKISIDQRSPISS